MASLGPGGRWGDVYATLDPYEVSVVGGRIPHVGVGGLILGGLAALLKLAPLLLTWVSFRWLLSLLSTVRSCCGQC